MKIFRVTMEVSDLDAAARFYATLLGDPRQCKDEKHLSHNDEHAYKG